MRIKDKARLAIAVGLASATVAATALAPATAFADYKGYHDVPANHWAVTGGVIDWAEYNGIINGFPDGSWGADMTVNRAQAAAMLQRTANLLGTVSRSKSMTFNDAGTISSYARESVDFVTSCGIMNGKGEGRFDPKGTYTREQAFITMLNTYNAVTPN